MFSRLCQRLSQMTSPLQSVSSETFMCKNKMVVFVSLFFFAIFCLRDFSQTVKHGSLSIQVSTSGVQGTIRCRISRGTRWCMPFSLRKHGTVFDIFRVFRQCVHVTFQAAMTERAGGFRRRTIAHSGSLTAVGCYCQFLVWCCHCDL